MELIEKEIEFLKSSLRRKSPLEEVNVKEPNKSIKQPFMVQWFLELLIKVIQQNKNLKNQ